MKSPGLRLPIGSSIRFDRSGMSVLPIIAERMPTTAFIDDRIGRPNKGKGASFKTAEWRALRTLLRDADYVVIQTYDGRPHHEHEPLGGEASIHRAALNEAHSLSRLIVLIACPSQRVRVWLTETNTNCSDECEIRLFDSSGVMHISSGGRVNGR